MTIAAFTTSTDPFERGDLFLQAISSYEGFSDELVLVDGSKYFLVPAGIHEVGSNLVTQVNYHWPEEFSWEFIGEQFQRGYEAAVSDWVMHCDLDFIFHERDYGRVRQAIKDYPSAPAISFYKWQFIQPDRYNLKSRLVLAVNKGMYGDRIRFDGGGDLCQPTLDGKDIDVSAIPQSGVPFYNYEHILKTREQVTRDVGRMDRAYHRRFDKWLYSKDGTESSAIEGWLEMMVGRYNRPSEKLALYKHPKVMQSTIQLLKPEQWGYDGWGLLKG